MATAQEIQEPAPVKLPPTIELCRYCKGPLDNSPLSWCDACDDKLYYETDDDESLYDDDGETDDEFI